MARDTALNLIDIVPAELEPQEAEVLELVPFERIAKQAEAGDTRALYLCGAYYLGPKASESDYAKAFNYLERAAARGHGRAQYMTAILCLRGLSDYPEDPIRASALLSASAAQGFEAAAAVLDYMMRCGRAALFKKFDKISKIRAKGFKNRYQYLDGSYKRIVEGLPEKGAGEPVKEEKTRVSAVFYLQASPEEIASRIRTAREAKGWSQLDLAKAMGKQSRRTVQNLEAAHDGVTVATVRSAMQALDLTEL